MARLIVMCNLPSVSHRSTVEIDAIRWSSVTDPLKTYNKIPWPSRVPSGTNEPEEALAFLPLQIGSFFRRLRLQISLSHSPRPPSTKHQVCWLYHHASPCNESSQFLQYCYLVRHGQRLRVGHDSGLKHEDCNIDPDIRSTPLQLIMIPRSLVSCYLCCSHVTSAICLFMQNHDQLM